MGSSDPSSFRGLSRRSSLHYASSRRAQLVRWALATLLPGLLLAATAVPVSADNSTVTNPGSTYVNANFGPYDGSGFNFYRSKTTLDFDSATADVNAERSASEVHFSVSANHDPQETSAAYSAYDIGTVNTTSGNGNLTK